MTPESAKRLDILTTQFTEHLMSAAFCAKEIGDLARAEIDAVRMHLSRHVGGQVPASSSRSPRPLLEESTLSVFWKDKTLHLGHTRSFWLLSRLARRPNQYVTHLDLLRDVWDNEELATATVRSLVRELRHKLRQGGMADLAAAIRGHNGRYILDL